MSTDLIRQQLEESLAASSLEQLVREQGDNPFLLVDTSSSMECYIDPSNNKRAIDALRTAVDDIQSSAAVRIPMIAFGGPEGELVRFVDKVPEPYGGTPLHLALSMAREYGASRVVVISDGMPDLREQCLDEAKKGRMQIDVVFIGATTYQHGSDFLEELAKLTGGQRLQGDLRQLKQLTSIIIGLLEGPKDEEGSAPLQGEGFTMPPSSELPAAPETDEDEDDEDEDDEDDEDEDEDEDGDDDGEEGADDK
jgi:hypothetical protein